jgi:hypothetical protein
VLYSAFVVQKNYAADKFAGVTGFKSDDDRGDYAKAVMGRGGAFTMQDVTHKGKQFEYKFSDMKTGTPLRVQTDGSKQPNTLYFSTTTESIEVSFSLCPSPADVGNLEVEGSIPLLTLQVRTFSDLGLANELSFISGTGVHETITLYVSGTGNCWFELDACPDQGAKNVSIQKGVKVTTQCIRPVRPPLPLQIPRSVAEKKLKMTCEAAGTSGKVVQLNQNSTKCDQDDGAEKFPQSNIMECYQILSLIENPAEGTDFYPNPAGPKMSGLPAKCPNGAECWSTKGVFSVQSGRDSCDTCGIASAKQLADFGFQSLRDHGFGESIKLISYDEFATNEDPKKNPGTQIAWTAATLEGFATNSVGVVGGQSNSTHYKSSTNYTPKHEDAFFYRAKLDTFFNYTRTISYELMQRWRQEIKVRGDYNFDTQEYTNLRDKGTMFNMAKVFMKETFKQNISAGMAVQLNKNFQCGFSMNVTLPSRSETTEGTVEKDETATIDMSCWFQIDSLLDSMFSEAFDTKATDSLHISINMGNDLTGAQYKKKLAGAKAAAGPDGTWQEIEDAIGQIRPDSALFGSDEIWVNGIDFAYDLHFPGGLKIAATTSLVKDPDGGYILNPRVNFTYAMKGGLTFKADFSAAGDVALGLGLNRDLVKFKNPFKRFEWVSPPSKITGINPVTGKPLTEDGSSDGPLPIGKATGKVSLSTGTTWSKSPGAAGELGGNLTVSVTAGEMAEVGVNVLTGQASLEIRRRFAEYIKEGDTEFYLEGWFGTSNDPSAPKWGAGIDLKFETTLVDFSGGRSYGPGSVFGKIKAWAKLGATFKTGVTPTAKHLGSIGAQFTFGASAGVEWHNRLLSWMGFPFDIGLGPSVGVGYDFKWGACSSYGNCTDGGGYSFKVSMGIGNLIITLVDSARNELYRKHDAVVNDIPYLGGMLASLPIIQNIGDKESINQYAKRVAEDRAARQFSYCIGAWEKKYMAFRDGLTVKNIKKPIGLGKGKECTILNSDGEKMSYTNTRWQEDLDCGCPEFAKELFCKETIEWRKANPLCGNVTACFNSNKFKNRRFNYIQKYFPQSCYDTATDGKTHIGCGDEDACKARKKISGTVTVNGKTTPSPDNGLAIPEVHQVPASAGYGEKEEIITYAGKKMTVDPKASGYVNPRNYEMIGGANAGTKGEGYTGGSAADREFWTSKYGDGCDNTTLDWIFGIWTQAEQRVYDGMIKGTLSEEDVLQDGGLFKWLWRVIKKAVRTLMRKILKYDNNMVNIYCRGYGTGTTGTNNCDWELVKYRDFVGGIKGGDPNGDGKSYTWDGTDEDDSPEKGKWDAHLNKFANMDGFIGRGPLLGVDGMCPSLGSLNMDPDAPNFRIFTMWDVYKKLYVVRNNKDLVKAQWLLNGAYNALSADEIRCCKNGNAANVCAETETNQRGGDVDAAGKTWNGTALSASEDHMGSGNALNMWDWWQEFHTTGSSAVNGAWTFHPLTLRKDSPLYQAGTTTVNVNFNHDSAEVARCVSTFHSNRDLVLKALAKPELKSKLWTGAAVIEIPKKDDDSSEMLGIDLHQLIHCWNRTKPGESFPSEDLYSNFGEIYDDLKLAACDLTKPSYWKNYTLITTIKRKTGNWYDTTKKYYNGLLELQIGALSNAYQTANIFGNMMRERAKLRLMDADNVLDRLSHGEGGIADRCGDEAKDVCSSQKCEDACGGYEDSKPQTNDTKNSFILRNVKQPDGSRKDVELVEKHKGRTLYEYNVRILSKQFGCFAYVNDAMTITSDIGFEVGDATSTEAKLARSIFGTSYKTTRTRDYRDNTNPLYDIDGKLIGYDTVKVTKKLVFFYPIVDDGKYNGGYGHPIHENWADCDVSPFGHEFVQLGVPLDFIVTGHSKVNIPDVSYIKMITLGHWKPDTSKFKNNKKVKKSELTLQGYYCDNGIYLNTVRFTSEEPFPYNRPTGIDDDPPSGIGGGSDYKKPDAGATKSTSFFQPSTSEFASLPGVSTWV